MNGAVQVNDVSVKVRPISSVAERLAAALPPGDARRAG